VNFPVVARNEAFDFLFALDEDRERRRLHAPHGRFVKAPALRVERGHRPRSVDPHKPVGLGAARRCIGERFEFRAIAQALEAFPDCGRRHRLQPQPLDRLRILRVPHEIAENELAFAASVARVDDGGDVLALEQLREELQPRLALLDRPQVEVRRNHRQVRERPLAALHLVIFRRDQLQQVADGGRDDILVALEIIIVTLEAAESARDIACDGRFFGDDQFFCH
jgi:hypothetical protein